MNSDSLAVLEAIRQRPNSKALNDILAGTDGLDPRTRALLQLASAQTSVPDDEQTKRSKARRKSRLLIERARNIMSTLRDQLDSAVQIIDLAAEATGACHDCFGQDEQCPLCRGRGVPGWREPDPDLYRTLIQPIVSRVSAERGRAGDDPGTNLVPSSS